jgi:hypothetical protein
MQRFAFPGRWKPGFQRHHLIPVNLIRSRCFAGLFSLVVQSGFAPHCFASNGMQLPATEAVAAATGLPLHRGPHPEYDALIAAHLSQIDRRLKLGRIATGMELLIQLSDLQGHLRRVLFAKASLRLNRRDPRRPDLALLSLDDDLIRLKSWACGQ